MRCGARRGEDGFRQPSNYSRLEVAWWWWPASDCAWAWQWLAGRGREVRCGGELVFVCPRAGGIGHLCLFKKAPADEVQAQDRVVLGPAVSLINHRISLINLNQIVLL